MIMIMIMPPRLMSSVPRYFATRFSTSTQTHLTNHSPSVHPTLTHNVPNISTRLKRLELFESERIRQQSLVSRIEKIQVHYEGAYETELFMNKHLSTPLDCARHLEEYIVKRSVTALVDGIPWDMNCPLNTDVKSLKLLHFHDEDPSQSELCNLAFWRSCSFALGMVLETAFKEEVSGGIQLIGAPQPDLKSGSFVYDVDLGPNLQTWQPTEEELKCLSALVGRLHWNDIPFEHLQVSISTAQSIFAQDYLKKQRISSLASAPTNLAPPPLPPYDIMAENDGKVIIHRLGDHIDITNGPLIPSSRFFQPGRFSITAIHPIGKFHRIQGVALPYGVPIHSYSYKILTNNAKHFNESSTIAVEENDEIV